MVRVVRALLGALFGLAVSVLNCDPDSGRLGVPVAHADAPAPNASDCMSFQNEVQRANDSHHEHSSESGSKPSEATATQ